MKLAIDMTSPAWFAVEAYCKARITDLTEQCVALTASPSDRERAAYRIAELQELMQAPRRTLAVARDAVENVRGTY